MHPPSLLPPQTDSCNDELVFKPKTGGHISHQGRTSEANNKTISQLSKAESLGVTVLDEAGLMALLEQSA